MADPISILGTYGAVANIIDVLAKTATTLTDLRILWGVTDPAVVDLESGLTALNVALNRIKEWIDSCSDEPHHQLTTDLDHCVICCRLLFSKIVGEMPQFQITVENQPNVANKLPLLLRTKDFEHVRHMVRNQTEAMELLLAACNTTTLSKKPSILEDTDTRKVLEEMENDTALLLARPDVDPLSTQTDATVNPLRLSNSNVLDSGLTLPISFMSPIYHRWIRGSGNQKVLPQQDEKAGISSRPPGNLYRSITTCLCGADYLQTLEAQQRSCAIDRALSEDAKRPRDECTVFVMGQESRVGIINAIKMQKPHLSQGEVSNLRSTIFENVLECAQWLVASMAEMELPPRGDEMHDQLDYIKAYTLSSSQVEGLGARFGIAIDAILKPRITRK